MGKGVTGEIRIKDSGTATLKNLKKETKALKDEVKSTSSELKGTFDKTYKPSVDSTKANQSLRALKTKKDTWKEAASAKIGVEDHVTSTISKTKSKLRAFGSMVISPIIKVKDLGSAKIRSINSKLITLGKRVIAPVVKIKDQITSKTTKIKGHLGSIGKTVAKPFIALKDGITSKLSPILGKMKVIGKMVIKPIAMIKDKVSPTLSKIGGAIKGMAKKLVIPVAATVVGLTAGAGMAVKSGMELEQQQISMKHFIGTTNKDMSMDQVNQAADAFTNALRENANATPFETGEVISAGSRAVAITQGNVNEAMSLVTLAEDMAAASGGTQSVADAMEALADAKMGETERLKSFGFKVSAEEMKSKGFAGVTDDLNDFFGGASEKLATSGAGLLSTITGKLKSGVSDFGLKIVDQLKPVLTDVIGFIDQIMPHIEKFGTAFASHLGSGIQWVKDNLPKIKEEFNKIAQPIGKVVNTVVESVKKIAVAAAPVVETIKNVIQQVLPVVEPVISKITEIITNIVVAVMPPLKAAIQGIGDTVQWLAPIVETVFGGIQVVVDNVIGGISGIIQGGMDLISSIWSGNWQGVVDAFGTIFGGIGEICKAPINAIIGILNGAIDAINSVSIDTPDWLPFGWGGQHLGFNLDKLNYLAKGGVVNSATPAIFGEAGKEAVVPLERNTGWMDPVAHRMLGILGNLSNGGQPVPAYAGGGDVYNLNVYIQGDSIDPDDTDKLNKAGEYIAKKIMEALKNR